MKLNDVYGNELKAGDVVCAIDYRGLPELLSYMIASIDPLSGYVSFAAYRPGVANEKPSPFAMQPKTHGQDWFHHHGGMIPNLNGKLVLETQSRKFINERKAAK